LYKLREEVDDVVRKVTPYSLPVGTTAESKGVEQRLSKDSPVEHHVDSSDLS